MEQDKIKLTTSDPDYDGHFDFRKLTPEQKLQWLSSIVMLAKTSKKIKAEE